MAKMRPVRRRECIQCRTPDIYSVPHWMKCRNRFTKNWQCYTKPKISEASRKRDVLRTFLTWIYYLPVHEWCGPLPVKHVSLFYHRTSLESQAIIYALCPGLWLVIYCWSLKSHYRIQDLLPVLIGFSPIEFDPFSAHHMRCIHNRCL